MKQIAHGKPLFINNQNQVIPLIKQDAFNEVSVQDLIFRHPECLPNSDIDESYNPVIPVCKEMHTTVGPLDILMEEQKEEIMSELGDELFWSGDESYADFGVRLSCDNVLATENREEIKEFFKNWLNNLVNVMPGLKEYEF